MHVGAEAAVKLEKAFDSKGSQEEWHCQSHRIDRQQHDSLCDRVLGGGESQDNRQDRSYAWRPAESEGEADHKGAPRGATAFYAVQARVRVQSFDFENSGEVQAE